MFAANYSRNVANATIGVDVYIIDVNFRPETAHVTVRTLTTCNGRPSNDWPMDSNVIILGCCIAIDVSQLLT